MVLEKRKNLKTLHNSGATYKEIKKIFYYQGLIITSLGGAAGLTFGYLLILAQEKFSLFMITSSLPYPVNPKATTFLIVAITILILGGFASKISSNAVTKDLINKS